MTLRKAQCDLTYKEQATNTPQNQVYLEYAVSPFETPAKNMCIHNSI